MLPAPKWQKRWQVQRTLLVERVQGGNIYLGHNVEADSGGSSTNGVLADKARGVVEEGG